MTAMEKLLEACRAELAMNFDCPAKEIMRAYAAKMGISFERLKKLLEADL